MVHYISSSLDGSCKESRDLICFAFTYYIRIGVEYIAYGDSDRFPSALVVDLFAPLAVSVVFFQEIDL